MVKPEFGAADQGPVILNLTMWLVDVLRYKKYTDIFCWKDVRKKLSHFFNNCLFVYMYEPRHEKTNILVSDLVRHKPGCTAIEDG